jgi:hypothetical protein
MTRTTDVIISCGEFGSASARLRASAPLAESNTEGGMEARRSSKSLVHNSHRAVQQHVTSPASRYKIAILGAAAGAADKSRQSACPVGEVTISSASRVLLSGVC